ncbi:MAG: hypothetical protein ACPG8W_12715 [Candidatus Promineifilaceae bacterium]
MNNMLRPKKIYLSIATITTIVTLFAVWQPSLELSNRPNPNTPTNALPGQLKLDILTGPYVVGTMNISPDGSQLYQQHSFLTLDPPYQFMTESRAPDGTLIAIKYPADEILEYDTTLEETRQGDKWQNMIESRQLAIHDTNHELWRVHYNDRVIVRNNWSPDSQYIAVVHAVRKTGREKNDIQIDVYTRSGERMMRLPEQADASLIDIKWPPFEDERIARLMEVGLSEQPRIDPPIWSPDGRWFVIGTRKDDQTTLHIINPNQQVHHPITVEADSVLVEWAKDSSRLVISHMKNHVSTLLLVEPTLATANTERLLQTAKKIRQIKLSPDNTHAVYLAGSEYYLVSIQDKAQQFLHVKTEPERSCGSIIRWSPTSAYVLVAACNKTARIISISDQSIWELNSSLQKETPISSYFNFNNGMWSHHTDRFVIRSQQFSADGDASKLLLFDPAKQQVSTLADKLHFRMMRANDFVHIDALAWDPTDRYVVFANTRNDTLVGQESFEDHLAIVDTETLNIQRVSYDFLSQSTLARNPVNNRYTYQVDLIDWMIEGGP